MSESLFTPERDDRDEVIAALQVSHAECARLRAELYGDGSPSSDPLRAFGVRGCLELQTEEIARLRQALDACRQEQNQNATVAVQENERANKAEAQLASLSAALRGLQQYARHKPDCHHATDPVTGELTNAYRILGSCTCGLADTLQALVTEPTEPALPSGPRSSGTPG